jgi:hypothetical protein
MEGIRMTASVPNPATDPDLGRPLTELRSTGLLWLINRVIFHPRGYALALHYSPDMEEVVGWSLMGDGTEPWSMGEPTPEQREQFGALSEDELFILVKEIMP